MFAVVGRRCCWVGLRAVLRRKWPLPLQDSILFALGRDSGVVLDGLVIDIVKRN
jgi:hypothetical protein